MSDAPEIQQAPCSSCLRSTAHDILNRIQNWDDDYREEYAFIRCRGCGTPSLREATYDVSDDAWGEPRYYPAPQSRKTPLWVIMLQLGVVEDKEAFRVGEMLIEVYEALRARHFRLAAMGIRAILENVMIAKVGDHKSFRANMEKFQEAGYISIIGYDAMQAVMEVGHAVIHRLHAPAAEDLGVAIDVLEGILAPIYAHKSAAEQMGARTPARPTRKPLAGSPPDSEPPN